MGWEPKEVDLWGLLRAVAVVEASVVSGDGKSLVSSGSNVDDSELSGFEVRSSEPH